MATVNFSIPDEIKEEFQRTFAHENRSAVVAGLMKQAIEEGYILDVLKGYQAYETALSADDTTMVLSPDSEFFEFFGNIDGRPLELDPVPTPTVRDPDISASPAARR